METRRANIILWTVVSTVLIEGSRSICDSAGV